MNSQPNQTKEKNITRFLFPIVDGANNQGVINLAKIFAATEPVLVAGFIPIPMGENLSGGALRALEMRKQLQTIAEDEPNILIEGRIRVTYDAWQEILKIIDQMPCVEWLTLCWPDHLKILSIKASELLENPPCNIAMLKGNIEKNIQKIVVPMRGGPHIEEALRFGIRFSEVHQSSITSIRVFKSEKDKSRLDANFKGLSSILDELSDIQQEKIVGRNLEQKILKITQNYDLTILGTASKPQADIHSFGSVTDKVLAEATSNVIAIKTKRFREVGTREFSSEAISVLVDRWFAENTFHSDEFWDVDALIRSKEEKGFSISLCLPALNEAKTIGEIINITKTELQDKRPLLDEIIVMDSNSEDKTREIAEQAGAKVFIHQEVLPQYGAYSGKGEALWKSLYVTSGDLIVWVDSDIKNFHPRFVYGIIGPLLHNQNLKYIKGFYKRPIVDEKGIVEPSRGGRVTELTARPLINLFYPELSGVIQPLSGEYGGKRSALENLTFTSGYGVETSLLIDMFEKFKLESIGQVDLIERIHRNQSLQNLSKMSFAIIQVMLSKLEKKYNTVFLEEVNKTMKIIHYGPNRMYLEVEEIVEIERPPMITIPEYREKFPIDK